MIKEFYAKASRRTTIIHYIVFTMIEVMILGSMGYSFPSFIVGMIFIPVFYATFPSYYNTILKPMIEHNTNYLGNNEQV